jgi:hypothetical protein
MDELNLNFGDLNLSILLVERQQENGGGPYLDWLKCKVRVSVPHFSGSFDWEVMPHELDALADELIRQYDQFPDLVSVVFEPVEPNIILRFDMTQTGGLTGNYSFCSDFIEGTTLKGQFMIDQSYLPGLANDIRAFVKAAG